LSLDSKIPSHVSIANSSYCCFRRLPPISGLCRALPLHCNWKEEFDCFEPGNLPELVAVWRAKRFHTLAFPGIFFRFLLSVVQLHIRGVEMFVVLVIEEWSVTFISLIANTALWFDDRSSRTL
jgi:hypothetical protein